MNEIRDDSQSSSVLGEWGDLLKKVPALGKAMTKLIGDAASAGSSWIDVLKAKGEQRSSYTRAITDARTQTIKAVSQEIKKQISVEEGGIGVRALDHFVGEIVCRQENREAVAAGALNLLARDGAVNTDTDISEDWLNVFSAHAEQASSERLRGHWAAILAGELRKPGSISLLTLGMMSVIDNHAAQVIIRLCKCILRSDDGYCIPLTGLFATSPHYDDLLYLEELNFLNLGMHSHSAPAFELGNFTFRHRERSNLPIQCAVLTRAGKELANLIHTDISFEDAEYMYFQLTQDIAGVQLLRSSTAEILLPLHEEGSSA